MPPMSKKNRSSVACNLCRECKLRCNNNNDGSQCQRCDSLKLSCSYTLKKSQIHKKSLPKTRPTLRNADTNSLKGIQANKRSPNKNIAVILPEKCIIIEVAEIFFKNQYKGIFPFVHKPSLIAFLKSDEFNPETYINEYNHRYFKANFSNSLKYPDPIILLAILGLCSRLHPILSSIYGRFSETEEPESFAPDILYCKTVNGNIQVCNSNDNDGNLNVAHEVDFSDYASNASNYFGWHARNLLKDVFDSPTIQRIQSLTLLSSHEWGEGNTSRSYLYIGIAARMALVLGLGDEKNLFADDDNIGEGDDVSKLISIECKRRTLWSVYMMDRCNSSGRERSPAIRIEEIRIKLPCAEEDFIFGNDSNAQTYVGIISSIEDKNTQELNKVSFYGFTIILFEIWSKIAKWVGEIGGKYEIKPPWDPHSTFASLSDQLESFQSALPRHLIYNSFNLEAHISQGSAPNFGYLHGLLFLCRIFLNREYLFCDPDSFTFHWWRNSVKYLMDSVEKLSTLIHSLKLRNLMVIAPFTGFELFTAAVTGLYFHAFPSDIIMKNYPFIANQPDSVDREEVINMKEKFKIMSLDNIEGLRTWSNVWGLGKKWHNLARVLQEEFENFSADASSNIQNETIRHTMHDYGNGEVQEVYNPKGNSKVKIVTSVLKNGVFTPSTHGDNILLDSSTAKADSLMTGKSVYRDDAMLNYLSSPTLNFIHSFDSASIFPGWSDNLEI